MSLKPIREGKEEIIEAKIRTPFGQSERWTVMMSDLWIWADIIAKRYNIKRKENGLEVDKDLDWLK